MPSGVDYAKVEAHSRRPMRLGCTTIGNPADPCVVISPGGGATKAMSLFWARDLAAAGPFFLILYDTRCSAESEGYDLEAIFGPHNTTAGREMKKMFGMGGKDKEQAGDTGDADKADRAAGTRDLHSDRNYDLPPEIMEQLHDFDAHAHDLMRLLDARGIEKAHLMGLSQGGAITLVTAMLYPERVLSAVAAAAPLNEATSMLGMFARGADDFYEKLGQIEKEREAAAKEVDGAQKKLPKEQYIHFKTRELEVLIPGFPTAVYAEMASLEFEYGPLSEDDCGVAALAWANWRNQGKIEQLHRQLQENERVPIMLVQGKADPICWYGHFQKLFATCGHAAKEEHEFGHNFGPPEHQRALIGRVASWMKRNAGVTKKMLVEKANQRRVEAIPKSIGADTFAAIGVSAEVLALGTDNVELRVIYDAFCQAQTAADTVHAFGLLLNKLGLAHLRGQGLKQFLEVSRELRAAPGLVFKQKKLVQDLDKALSRAHGVVARMRRGSGSTGVANQEAVTAAVQETVFKSRGPGGRFKLNKVVVCGAGPVGLRAACELALLGFEVRVVEKRPNFSRANILTFWDGTMQDMLALGAKTYFPDLQPTGGNKFLGTRQIQVCLLKTLLLLGGSVEYGREICGLTPPSGEQELGAAKWQAKFRPYVRHRRAQATDFQACKVYAVSQAVAGLEECEVDENFLGTGPLANSDPTYSGDNSEPSMTPLEFDAYFIAEGGWSDSTRKLGFDKNVENFKPVFGLVINMQYDPTDLKERDLKSSVHFALSGDFPLRQCRVQAEFVEYLKGETHFFALVVAKKNVAKDQTESYLAKLSEEDRKSIPEAMLEQMRFATTQKGLVEMGVLKEEKNTGRECLAEGNVDEAKLRELAREIVTEMGLPPSAKFYETNPVQLFDFSRRARCVEPVRVLDSSGGKVIGPTDFVKSNGSGGSAADTSHALVFPVGDALQEPNWTQGLGINRGFHTAMNQAYSLLVARERSLTEGVQEAVKIHHQLQRMAWGGGASGLAGSGTGCPDLTPFREWDTDPRSRFRGAGK